MELDNIEQWDSLFDTRTECWSVLTTMSIETYLRLVSSAHASRGGIKGQRDVLKTTTAKRIRTRLVNDIKMGAVLPAVVVGIALNQEAFSNFRDGSDFKLGDVTTNVRDDDISIIDGMQRTAALLEAVRERPEIADKRIRVEFWLTKGVRALIYRMLVLNTGQVPWTLNRQLTVVYRPLLEDMSNNVSSIVKIFTDDKEGRRVAAGQYSGNDLVELYLAFSLRKTNVDSKEALSEEFSRLDFVENVAEQEFQDHFYKALHFLASLDREFSRFENVEATRMSKGRNIFDGQPARIGFVVALGQRVLGRPGADFDLSKRKELLTSINSEFERFLLHLKKMNTDELGDFLKLDVLSEILDRRVGQVGRYERSVFYEAFKVLIEDRFEVSNLEPCWRAG